MISRLFGLRRAVAALGSIATVALGLAAVSAAKPTAHHGTKGSGSNLKSRVFASSSTLTNPDDITSLHGRIFVVWQNQTQPDGSGPGTSTVVSYRYNGKPAGSWNLSGHVDGLAADPANHRVIATTDEDANSSLYTITPDGHKADQLHHYTYSPDPTTLTGGGTDAISILHGKILISASNPQNSTGPAVFAAAVPREGTTATLTPYFNDDSTASNATTGQSTTLNLTDPDSNAIVPQRASKFGGDFVLDSQGDSELIFAADHGSSAPSLTVLDLNAGTASTTAPQVDDVRWITSPHGTLFMTDGSANRIYAVTGSFGTGSVVTAVPGDSPSLAGDVGSVNISTGTVTPIMTGFQSPKGLLYLPGRAGGQH